MSVQEHHLHSAQGCCVRRQLEGQVQRDGWVRDQAIHDSDCLGDKAYTFTLVRSSGKNGVHSQGTRHFLGGIPSRSDLPFVDTSSLFLVSVVLLWASVPLTDGKTAFSFMLYLDLGME